MDDSLYPVMSRDLFERTGRPRLAYWLVMPARSRGHAAVRAVFDWLKREAVAQPSMQQDSN